MGLSLLGSRGLLALARKCGHHLPCVHATCRHLPFVHVSCRHLPCVQVSCRHRPCVQVSCRNFSLHTAHCASSTYYEDLGITPQASSKQIKEAYFTLSKQYHPDATANDEVLLRKFQSVSEAYGVLSNPKLRRAYDRGKLGEGSSVADGEVSAHQFDQEKFYDSRAANRLKTARGQQNLDDWIMEHRTDTFHKNKRNLIKNAGNVKNMSGSRGIANHNRATNNPVTDRILGKVFGYTLLTFSILYFVFR